MGGGKKKKKSDPRVNAGFYLLVSSSWMRKCGASCCRGNQTTNKSCRLGKLKDAHTKIKQETEGEGRRKMRLGKY